MNKASLTLVGSGIKSISHLTVEAQTYIKQVDKLLYLVNEPALQQWMAEANPHSEALDHLYFKYPARRDCYQAITVYILETLYQQQHVGVVLYGHPTVFAQPALNAVLQAKKEGYETYILPGISAEDCLFADLAIDPGTYGCQSFEATDFLIRQHDFSPYNHLILWQVGIIGMFGHLHQQDNYDNHEYAKILVDYLTTRYPLEHPAMLYEAAQYPGFHPKIVEMALKDFPKAESSSISTLYIPPVAKAPYDKAMLVKLGIDEARLK